LSERQTPQLIEKPENTIEMLEPKEGHCRLHTQEVTGSSPVAPTIRISNLQAADAKAHPFAHPDRVARRSEGTYTAAMAEAAPIVFDPRRIRSK